MPSIRSPLSGVVLLVTLFFAGCGGVPAPSTGSAAPARAGVVIEKDVAVPMRDGVVLRADVYRPRGHGPFPVLVYRTPYGKSAAAESYDTHLAAVRRGYAVVLQDVRGRYASDGIFEPYRNEGRDGFDTIEWAAAREWSSGTVGTFGLSYPGAVQWLAALESPPHLEAMVPAMTFSSPRNFFYMNGVFDLSWLSWIYVNIAPDARKRLDLPGIRSSDEAAERWPELAGEYRGWLPLADLPYLRDAAPYYFEWLKHPPDDPWWDWAEVRGRYTGVDAAVFNLSGWHDEAYGPEGAVTNYRGLLAARRGSGSPRTHLLLGPWTHGVGATMSRRAGDLDFGPAAAIDYDDEVLDFFDYYLRGVENRFATDLPVRYFLMGENRWHGAAAWPPTATRIETLYLSTRNREAPNRDTQEAPNRDTQEPVAPDRDTHSSGGASTATRVATDNPSNGDTHGSGDVTRRVSPEPTPAELRDSHRSGHRATDRDGDDDTREILENRDTHVSSAGNEQADQGADQDIQRSPVRRQNTPRAEIGGEGNAAVGRLSPNPAPARGVAATSFVADPANPVVDPYDGFGPHDYQALTARPDVLTFDTEPFGKPTPIAGSIDAILYASCECRDFDLWVRVLDVYPDGKAINLMSPGNDMLRASYRDVDAGRRLVQSGQIYRLELSGLLTANLFLPGHRLRVQISASFSPHFSRNLQSGESEIRSAEPLKARITIHHDDERRSSILIPVLTALR